jgi:anti-sigma regulatory factor (Ser/Thr protein kinase)
MKDDNNKILIKSSTKNLAEVRNFIEEKALLIGLDSQVINQIILSVDEACTNIIKYTHNYNDTNTIEVKVSDTDNQFQVEIKYKGEGFDPNKVKTPDMVEYFKNYKVGGLGIPMMKKFMNKIEYNHIKPDLNQLILTKSL